VRTHGNAPRRWSPRLLLKDEPFGTLDALAHAHLQDELMKIAAAIHCA